MSFLKNIFGKQSDELTENQSEITTTDAEQEAPLVFKKTIKRQQIKHHLLTKGSIDSWTAIQMYGETRLSAVIFDLRMVGYDISSIPKSALDRNGNLTNFTTYVLNKQN
jgi:hypothetical protein